jgi:IclR family transcriptional regulator, acetate operon repressor
MSATFTLSPDRDRVSAVRLLALHARDSGGEDSARAVIRGAFEVLAALEHLGSARVSEVQRNSGLPRTTVQRLLVQLEAVGAVERAAERWRLGPTMVLLAAEVPAQPRLRSVARRPLLDLAFATGALVALSVEMAGHPVVVDVVPGKARLPCEPEPGMVLGLPTSAVARAHERARRGDLRPVTDVGGLDPRISCLAVPMRLSVSDVAVVSVMVPSARGVPELLVQATRRIADRITSDLSNLDRSRGATGRPAARAR